jgi:hypothetical protein
MTRQQVRSVFDKLLADYVDHESEVVVDAVIYLNSIGKTFEGTCIYDAASGLLVIDHCTYVRCEQISALLVREVRTTS